MTEYFPPVDITELTLNVTLAQLLGRRELQALGEVVIHRKAEVLRKRPDL